MESELAKTLRSMSDDHRMVPDFSEQLLDIADTIERLQKELDLSLKAEKSAVHTAAEVIQERDAAMAEVERLKAELRGIYSDQAASDQARIEIRRKSDAMGR